MTEEISAQLSPADLARLTRDVREFDPHLLKEMRNSLRAAAAPAVQAVRQVLQEPTPGGRPFRSGGVRANLARGTRITMNTTSEKSAGIRITTTAGSLTAAHKAMIGAYNKASWRHPVFGRGSVSQSGRPYFGSVIERRQADYRRAVEQAIEDTAAAVGGRS